MIKPSLLADMEAKGIDIVATLEILAGLNDGTWEGTGSVDAVGVPAVDGISIVALSTAMSYELPEEVATDRLGALGIGVPATAASQDGKLRFGHGELVDIGERLYGITAWGVLNGGSATSYADRKKNAALGTAVFNAIKPGFELLAPLCEGRPKGITPAYINPDGSPGEGFLVLKMRAALLRAARYVERFGRGERPPLPFFQMTSKGTDQALKEAYRGYSGHPWLANLIAETGSDPTRPRTAVQTMLAAFSHPSEGQPRHIFDRAWGKPDSALALPGGHGQSFRILAEVYRNLLADGYRYAYLGNVDNIGYYPNPAELAVMALSGAEAAFEFSYRTAVDVKGGILVTTGNGRKTVADLGQAISIDEAARLEATGQQILFNCATGLFDLAALVPDLDRIARNLPVRISDQDKDAGRYSQAEQSTWEVIGLLESPLGFAVEKKERFLAAKLLAETVMASGTMDIQAFPEDLKATALTLSSGLAGTLEGPCSLKLVDGRWISA
ncbi:MAG: UTP--glucose-1-phosphate uridylyltransferase [Spirochaetota bacterium]